MREFRPMTVSEILDTTFRLYRERFLTFLLIALIVYVPYSLLATLVTPAQNVPTSSTFVPPGPGHANPRFAQPVPSTASQFNAAERVPGMLLNFLYFFVVMPLCTAALTLNISAAYLGKELSAAESYQRALPRLAPLMGTQILVGIIFALGLLLLVVPGIIFGLWFYVVPPVVVLEVVGGTAALGRSRELMRGNLGKGFLLAFVVFLVAFGFGLIIGLLFLFIPWPYPFLGVFFLNLVEGLVLPITTAPITLLYYDLRIRKEAFDLQMLSTAMVQPGAIGQPAT